MAKAANEKVAKAVDMMTGATTVTMTAAMDRDPTGGMADTTTGVATAAPGTMVDEVATDGALAPMAHPLRTRGSVVGLSHRSLMEDDRYESRKQNGPDFIANAGSSGGSASIPHEGGVDHEAADGEFDAALEKQRKHRREMKANTHKKLGSLANVAVLLECAEAELATRWPMANFSRKSS